MSQVTHSNYGAALCASSRCCANNLQQIILKKMAKKVFLSGDEGHQVLKCDF